MDKLKFYSYRFFIVPFEQMSFYNEITITKEELVEKVFKNLEKSHKYTFVSNNKKGIVYYTKKTSEDMYLCKLARECTLKTHNEGEYDIEELAQSTYPFVRVIIDIKKQKILVEKKPSILKGAAQIEKLLQDWLNSTALNEGYEFIIEAISDEKQFWKKVDETQYIYSLEIQLNAPNLFGGKADANELMKEAKEAYNNTSMTIKLENDKGNLQLAKEKIKSFIEYATAGGGKWTLKGKNSKKSKMQTTTSREQVKQVNLRPDIENISHEEANAHLYKTFEEVETMLIDDVNE